MEVNMTKILLVEDDKSLREIYGVRLLAEGYQIASAGDGEEALAMAVRERPDLIIADVMMPKISGFDMLDILRSTPETKDIKVIMMTALSSEDQRARGESLGANRYLVKSQVGIEDVVRTVHDVLADAPITVKPTAQAFGAPAPTTIVTPQPTVNVSGPALTIPNIPSPSSFSNPTPAVSVAPAGPSVMPQPTAPFSTPSTAPIGDRTINPISSSSIPDISNRINQELNGSSTTLPPAPRI
jgi:CheY-like chemotaxis protein